MSRVDLRVAARLSGACCRPRAGARLGLMNGCPRLTAAGRLRSSNVRSRLQLTSAAFTAKNRFISKLPVDVVGQPNFRLAQQRTNALDPTQGVRSA